ncbi:MAG: tRNA preQ1(34) S-adenosylmethionine ribosyltransferase-isomerase QueA [Candidatus Cloacimonetes bacterium]|nr:tRNA preQ1(34) S-adenosylmethionine ribosyltransferase-isomerase QueA [Candidatus Cloacimonadota bacterium]
MTPDLNRREAFSYHLPTELIAQYPAEKRENSRLMHLHTGDQSINHRLFVELPSLLRSGDLLVLNNSKVFPARLFGRKDNGTKIEVLLLNPSSEPDKWKCLLYPAKRIKQEQYITFSNNMKGWVYPQRIDDVYEIKLEYKGDFWQEIESIGHIPLPPYIARPDESSDKTRYQTVYARQHGSVAAPTAGLHFSKDLIQKCKDMGVQFTELTLHVGIGTFRPVKTELITEHTMHSECVEILPETAKTINKAKAEGRRIISVGTTSVRGLESFWEAGELQSGNRWTDIFIYPGYKFKVPDAIITNFHLPESTLLMMVSAFAGFEFIRKAYQVAIAERYRFFSYGDAMYIEL